jgi:hypothetical protein
MIKELDPFAGIIVYGAPTTGKTYAQQMLRKMGYSTVDSDDVMERMFGREKMANFMQVASQAEINQLFAEIENSRADFLFTNLLEFAPIADFRFSRDRDTLKRIMIERLRESGREEDISKYSWLQNWKPLANSVILPYGRFISDYIDRMITIS